MFWWRRYCHTLLAKKNTFDCIIYCELNKVVFDGVNNAFLGTFEIPKDFVTKEKFDPNKYAHFFLYSFNGTTDYAFSSLNEKKENAFFNAIFKNDTYLFNVLFNTFLEKYDFCSIYNFKNEFDLFCYRYNILIEELKKNKLNSDFCKNYLKEHSINELTRFKYFENYKRILNMKLTVEERSRMVMFLGSYQKLFIVDPKDSIIYCDPPYENTKDYSFNKEKFNFNVFLNWAREKENIYISSYEINDKDFYPIMELDKLNNFNKNKIIERVYTNRKTDYKDVQIKLF